MNPVIFQDMYRYNYWANRLVWECLMELPEATFTQEFDFSYGNLRELCIHIMGVEYWWFHFLRTGELVFLKPADYPTRASVAAEWQRVEKDVTAYLNTLTDAELTRAVHPAVWDANRKPIQVWQALYQVANHSTDHRAQVLSLIHRMGGRTIEQDYLGYLFEQQRGQDGEGV